MQKAEKGDLGAAVDALTLLENSGIRDEDSLKHGRRLRDLGRHGISRTSPEKWYDVWERSMRWLAFSEFETFMEYLEIDRPEESRFWIPRRKPLARVATALQDVADGKLDELIINLPPRTGKSTITMFWLVWMMGRDPEKSHLYTSFSDTVTSAFYKGVREIIDDPYTYRYADVFPLAPLVSTNASNSTLDLQRKKRYSTLTCRSIDGTLNGACDASGAMIGDDLCSGIEEAKSPSRMDNLNAKVNNDWLSRRKQGCPVVWMGTRWSLQDPIGRREKILTDDANFQKVRWRKVSIPALDSQEQSNFVMPYGVGFSRQDYRRIRAQFERDEDMASWLAMYQQQPVERQGAVFDPAKLRTFSGDVPEGRVFMAVDPAFGGGDFTAAPICVDTGEDVYIPAVVFSDAEKDITMPLLADAVLDWKVEKVQFEANKMLQSYVDEFRRLLRARGIRITVTSQPASTRYSKADRIHDKAPDIRRHFLFLEPNDRPRDYTRFMQQVYAFTSKGGMKHDDAPDSLAMAASMVYRFQNDRAEVFRRPI